MSDFMKDREREREEATEEEIRNGIGKKLGG